MSASERNPRPFRRSGSLGQAVEAGSVSSTKILDALKARLLRNFARANAGRADQQRLASPIDQGVNAPQIGLPAPLSDIVGVTDSVSERRTFATDLTGTC